MIENNIGIFKNYIGISTLIIYLIVIIFLIKNKKRDISFIFVYIAIVIASIPAFYNIIFSNHDAAVHMGRIAGIASTIKTGQFPARIYTWVRNSYGWAAGIMYPSLFLYIPALFGIILNLSTQESLFLVTNTYIILVHIFTAEFMYITCKEIFNDRKSGTVGAIFITLCSYRLYDAYGRGAYGELTAFMSMSLVVLGLYYIYSGKTNKWWILTIAITFILESHLISIFIVAVEMIIFFVVFIKKTFDKKIFLTLIKSFVFIVLMNLMLLVPIINFLSIGIKNTSVEKYVADTSVLDSLNNLNGIGLLFIVIAAITLILLIYYYKSEKETKEYRVSLYCFIFSLVAYAFSTSKIISFIIHHLTFFNNIYRNIQFSYRWWCVAITLMTISASYLIVKFLSSIKVLQKIIITVCFSATILLSINTFRLQLYNFTHQTLYNHIRPNMDWSDYSYEDTSMDYENVVNNKLYSNSPSINILKYDKKGLTVTFKYKYNSYYENAYVVCPLFYYPVYEAVDNKGNKLNISKVENHLLGVHLSNNNKSGSVTVRYVGYPYWKFIDIISYLSIVLFIFVVLKENCPKKMVKS